MEEKGGIYGKRGEAMTQKDRKGGLGSKDRKGEGEGEGERKEINVYLQMTRIRHIPMWSDTWPIGIVVIHVF